MIRLFSSAINILLVLLASLLLMTMNVQAAEITGKGSAIKLSLKLHKIEKINKSVSMKDGKYSEEEPRTTETDALVYVTIFPNIVKVSNAESEVIYDFKTRKLTTLNLLDKTYFNTALYAVPMFNIIEKSNQSMIFKGFAKAKIDFPDKPDEFDLDMNFGGKYNPALMGEFKTSSDQDTTIFTYKGQQVASYKLSFSKIPDAFKISYIRFLAYNTKVHPAIFSKMKEQNFFLEFVSFTNKSIAPASVTITYSLEKIEDVSDVIPTIPGDFKPDIKGEPVYARIVDAIGKTPESTRSVDVIQSLYANKKYLDAIIAFIGHSLTYGTVGMEQLAPTVQGVVKDAPPESKVRDVLALCSRQPSKEMAEQAIQAVGVIQGLSPDYGYMLNGCLATYYQATGKNKEAQRVRVSALERNPYLVAVIKDLGDGYYMGFNTFQAWTYWDLARQMNGSFNVAQQISEMEARVRSEMPDYF